LGTTPGLSDRRSHAPDFADLPGQVVGEHLEDDLDDPLPGIVELELRSAERIGPVDVQPLGLRDGRDVVDQGLEDQFLGVGEHGVADAVVDLEVSEPGVVFVAAVSVADVAEPQASVDIAVAFDGSVPVSVVVVEADSSGRPKSLAFPNVDHYASSSSSVEVVG